MSLREIQKLKIPPIEEDVFQTPNSQNQNSKLHQNWSSASLDAERLVTVKAKRDSTKLSQYTPLTSIKCIKQDDKLSATRDRRESEPRGETTNGYQETCPRADNTGNTNKWKYSQSNQDTVRETMASGSGMNGFYRPRSALARALYEKHRNDRYLEEYDHTEWYRIDKTRLSPDLLQKFVQLDPDEETKECLSNSIDKSTWVWTQIWYLVAKAVLKHFWSITDINGWLGRGSMFVLSEAQARSLLGSALASRGEGPHATRGVGSFATRVGGSLVDIGAGDGEVSRRFAHLYTDKYATEISGSMRKVLGNKGYKILDTDEWWRGQQFDCVCMMNLLDRCSKPRTMLKQARAAIASGGVLMLALVLPYKPYVEVTADHKPAERLPITGNGFEEQVASFIKFMADEAAFELASWTRAPYLCEGDFAQAYYWLDDSVYVFTPKRMESA